MKRAQWWLSHWQASLDPVAAGCVVAMIAAVALHWGVTVPAGERLEQERTAHRQRNVQERQVQRASASVDAGEAAMAGVAGRLPIAGAVQLGALLERIQAAADTWQLQVESGTYQLEGAAGGDIERYSISLPIKGNYPAVRAFIRQVLAETPGLALDSVAFNRPGRGSPLVEVRLDFSAYARRP
jgi:hypothetical protein